MRRNCCLITLVLLTFTSSGLASWHFPEPFRLDRVDGRDFEYRDDSFLHRLSYQPQPLIHSRHQWQQAGVFGTAGSTRRDEFFVRSQAALDVSLDGPLFLAYRFERDEDFDGWRDYNLFGLGLRQNAWSASVWGDFLGNKEEMELRSTLAWQDDGGSYFSLTLAAPHVLVNQLNELERGYDIHDRPLTLHLKGGWAHGEGQLLYGFLNWNKQTRFLDIARDWEAEDQQTSWGIGLQHRINPQWSLAAEFESLSGDRSRLGRESSLQSDQLLIRNYRRLALEGLYSQHRWSGWLGLQYMQFDEDDQRPLDPMAERLIERQETSVFAGLDWQWTERVSLVPAVYMTHLDNLETTHPDYFWFGSEDNGWIGKISPGVRFLVGRETGASITFNVSMYTHRQAFGGGNLQLSVPLP